MEPRRPAAEAEQASGDSENQKRNTIAIVTPWYDPGLIGGAERQARLIARLLAEGKHDVEVLTTCSRSFHDDWGTNSHQPGQESIQGVAVRRFPADIRDKPVFDLLNAVLLSIPKHLLHPGLTPVPDRTAELFFKQSIHSRALYRHLAEHSREYRCILFIPYLYGTSVNGLECTSGRTLLQPCLHDEVYAYLPQADRMFQQASGLCFNSRGEAALAARLYGGGILDKSVVTGEVVVSDTQDNSKPPASDLPDRFILVAGRREAEKNIPFFIRAFKNFRQAARTDLDAVLIGPGSTHLGDPSIGLHDFGLVPEQVKNMLISRCTALAVPSVNESFSLTMYEAWLRGRPVLVHSDCPATCIPVESSRGGFSAGTMQEWTDLFRSVAASSAASLSEKGSRGQSYARSAVGENTVAGRYAALLARLPESPHPTESPSPSRSPAEFLAVLYALKTRRLVYAPEPGPEIDTLFHLERLLSGQPELKAGLAVSLTTTDRHTQFNSRRILLLRSPRSERACSAGAQVLLCLRSTPTKRILKALQSETPVIAVKSETNLKAFGHGALYVHPKAGAEELLEAIAVVLTDSSRRADLCSARRRQLDDKMEFQA